MSAQAAATVHQMVAEHVCLESDEIEVPDVRAARKIQASVKIRSRIRGGALALDIFDYYYLAVSTMRPRSAPRQFALDLRFVDPSTRRNRHIPWRWLQGALGLTALSALGVWFLGSSPLPWWQNGWLWAFALLFTGTACAVLLCLYRTTETVALYSLTGRARLLEFTGGLGTFRAMHSFETKLAAHIRAAIAARGHTKAQRLRGEMREHFRLQELAVLSAQEYEDSKARILRSHE